MENDEYNILYTVTFLDSINSESECFINLSHFSAAVLIGVSYFAVERCQNIKPTMQNWMQEEIRAGSTERLLGINSVSYHWRQPKQEREKIQLQVLPSYIFIWISLEILKVIWKIWEMSKHSGGIKMKTWPLWPFEIWFFICSIEGYWFFQAFSQMLLGFNYVHSFSL